MLGHHRMARVDLRAGRRRRELDDRAADQLARIGDPDQARGREVGVRDHAIDVDDDRRRGDLDEPAILELALVQRVGCAVLRSDVAKARDHRGDLRVGEPVDAGHLDPAQGPIGERHTKLDRAAMQRIGDQALLELHRARPIVVEHPPEPAGTDEVRRRPAQHALGGRAHVEDLALGGAQRGRLGGVVQQRVQPRLGQAAVVRVDAPHRRPPWAGVVELAARGGRRRSRWILIVVWHRSPVAHGSASLWGSHGVVNGAATRCGFRR